VSEAGSRFEAQGKGQRQTKGIFVTGTDTGVGKTTVSAALALLLREQGVKVGVMKPVTSGCREVDGALVSDDAELLAFGAGLTVTGDLAPYLLREPIAPAAAAEAQGVRIGFARIFAAYHRLAEEYDFMIVEGAGGLMVPLAGGLLVADLVKELGLPLLVVARPDLGTVNHSLLTCFAARQLGIDLRGVVINRYPDRPGLAESTAPHLIDSLCGVPLLGRLPSLEAPTPEETVTRLAAWLATRPETRLLLREIGCA
jgi:dethiobiotin synthetase